MDHFDITDESSAGEGIPTSIHGDLMFEALTDTLDGVSGTEGMRMTEAQVYAQGVLAANGVRGVAGNEGFFSTIADAAKAGYEYIIKLFKSLYGFFFKRDAGEKIDATKKEVAANTKELKDVGSASVPDAEVDKQLKHAHSVGAAIEDIPTGSQAEFDKVMEQAAVAIKGNSAPDKRKALVALTGELPKVSKRGQENFVRDLTAVATQGARFEKIVENMAKDKKMNAAGMTSADSNAMKLLMAVITDATAFKGIAARQSEYPKKTPVLKTLSEAQALQKQIDDDLTASKSLIAKLNGHNSAINSAIQAMGGKIGAKSLDAEGKKEMECLKALLNISSRVAGYLKTSTEAQSKLSGTINKVFGL